MKQEGKTHDAFVANRSDFCDVAVHHGVHQGADAGLDEIDKLNRSPRPVERLAVLQRFNGGAVPVLLATAISFLRAIFFPKDVFAAAAMSSRIAIFW